MARSLVESLEMFAESSQQLADEREPDRATNGDIVMHLHDRFLGKAGALRFAAKLAKPYAARLAALERVAEAARNVMISKECCFLDLQDALAAVPEIPEES